MTARAEVFDSGPGLLERITGLLKQFGFALGLFIVGFVLGVGGADQTSLDQAYDRGSGDATVQFQQEAVREGHGCWQWCPDGPVQSRFAWTPRHVHWRGDDFEDVAALRIQDH